MNHQWLSGSFCVSQGIGTDEDTLIEILASRNNREILDIKKAYKEGSVQPVCCRSALVCHSSLSSAAFCDANVVIFLSQNTRRTWRTTSGQTRVEISGLFSWRSWRSMLPHVCLIVYFACWRQRLLVSGCCSRFIRAFMIQLIVFLCSLLTSLFVSLTGQQDRGSVWTADWQWCEVSVRGRRGQEGQGLRHVHRDPRYQEFPSPPPRFAWPLSCSTASPTVSSHTWLLVLCQYLIDTPSTAK